MISVVNTETMNKEQFKLWLDGYMSALIGTTLDAATVKRVMQAVEKKINDLDLKIVIKPAEMPVPNWPQPIPAWPSPSGPLTPWPVYPGPGPSYPGPNYPIITCTATDTVTSTSIVINEDGDISLKAGGAVNYVATNNAKITGGPDGENNSLPTFRGFDEDE